MYHSFEATSKNKKKGKFLVLTPAGRNTMERTCINCADRVENVFEYCEVGGRSHASHPER